MQQSGVFEKLVAMEIDGGQNMEISGGRTDKVFELAPKIFIVRFRWASNSALRALPNLLLRGLHS